MIVASTKLVLHILVESWIIPTFSFYCVPRFVGYYSTGPTVLGGHRRNALYGGGFGETGVFFLLFPRFSSLTL